MYLTQDNRPMPTQAPDLEAWFPGWQQKEAKQDSLHAVLVMVRNWSRQHFGATITMQRTPTLFGMQLIQHSLPQGYHYETIPQEGIVKLLHAICWPHRIETVNPGSPRHEYDARIAFLRHARRVPVYSAQTFAHDEDDQLELSRPGWYYCDVTVPHDWDHIGLVPSAIKSGNSRIYPRKPKESFVTWLSDYEVRLLRQHLWPYAIRKRILFAPANAPGGDPLRKFTTTLCGGIEGIETQSDFARNQHWQLMRQALRAIALHSIGQFHHSGGTESMVKDGKDYIVSIKDPLSTFAARWHHPEWSGAIWARARAAVTRKALTLPKETIIRINGDGILTDRDLGNLIRPDDFKVGSYRHKEVAPHA